MQIDMHFYGVYALARAAGINPDVARTIACASQYVDDCVEDRTMVLGDKTAIIPHMTSHKPTDMENCLPEDQWNVWVCFHFLPGNDEGAKSFIEKMVCTKNSPQAQAVLKHALDKKDCSFGPHLAGVAAHVFADTFSHFGFTGLRSEVNRVKAGSIKPHVQSESILAHITSKFDQFGSRLMGTVAEALPVGHGSVATYPDRPYLRWDYETEQGKLIVRNNADDYIEACRQLHGFFNTFNQGTQAHPAPAGARSWDSIQEAVMNILEHEGTEEDRIDLWKQAIGSGGLFDPVAEDKDISYTRYDWGPSCSVPHFEKNTSLDGCDSYLFFEAIFNHRNFVLRELLPSIGLLV